MTSVQTYWSKFHTYLADDSCNRQRKLLVFLIIDDVMNVSGHRISTTEVEARCRPKVAEAAVVGKLDELTVRHLRVRRWRRSGSDIAGKLPSSKTQQFTRPKYVTFTPVLPKTRSGKIMRRLLRDIAEGRTLGDTTTLADSTVVKELQSRAASEGAKGEE